MGQARVIARLILVVSMLNVLMMGHKNNMADAFFFLDLICASRIEALERQVSQLIASTQGGAGLSTTVPTIRIPSG